jgi:hypothetical protein
MNIAGIAGTTGLPTARPRGSSHKAEYLPEGAERVHQEEVAFAGDIPPAGEHLTLPRTLNPGKKPGCEYSDPSPSITPYIVTFVSAQL